jgi:hypothetical protein
MSRRPVLIIFDCCGVLVDSEVIVHRLGRAPMGASANAGTPNCLKNVERYDVFGDIVNAK